MAIWKRNKQYYTLKLLSLLELLFRHHTDPIVLWPSLNKSAIAESERVETSLVLL